MLYFSCDYLEGCHPRILEALQATNLEQTAGYGEDPHCAHAAALIREAFAVPEAAVHFLVGGTQANLTVIASLLAPYEGVLCAHTGHIGVHETGAVEATGHKVLPLPATAGKITGSQVREAVRLQADFEHTVRPGMVYVSMSTELGTVYTREELSDLYAACRECGLPLYVDGARLACALASPDTDLTPEIFASLCDVFTVGGTKNGALFGEAVVFRRPDMVPRFRYMIKRQGGMLAKGRLLGIQFEALMADGLYFALGRKAVEQALRIRAALTERGIPLAIDSSTNQQFAILTDEQREALARDFVLEFWEKAGPGRSVMRACTSWATPDEAVDRLCDAIRDL